MSTMLRILNPTSFFCHDPWDYLYGGGVCGGMNRGGYSSTQGSKISKPEGRGEDGEGGCSGEGFGVVGVGFCSNPSTRIP